MTELMKFPSGDIPVYSAAKEPILYIGEQVSAPIDASDKNPVLSFASNGDGSAGRNFVIHTQPFYIKAERIAFRAKEKNINLQYVWSQISDIKEKHGFSRTFLANRQNLSIVMVDLPVRGNGEFDLAKQQIVAEQFSLVNELKDDIKQKGKDFSELSVVVNTSEYNVKTYTLSELLEPIKGKSKYTKKYGDTHKGDYPVFSASANNPLTYIDTFDFDGNYLSWSTNGFAGTVTILEKKFSINGDRGLLLPLTENLDILYLKYILQPIFRRLAKGRKGDRGTDEFTKLYPSMIADVQIPFPVDVNGNISLTDQQKIANSYAIIEQYKREILEKLNTILEQKISY